MGRSASANKDARFSCLCEISMAKMSPYMGEQVFHQLDHFNFGVLAAQTGKVLQDKETSVLVGRRSKEAQHLPGAFQELAYFILTKAPTRWVLLLPAFHGCGNRSSGRSQEPASPDPGNPKGRVPAATVGPPPEWKPAFQMLSQGLLELPGQTGVDAGLGDTGQRALPLPRECEGTWLSASSESFGWRCSQRH